MISSRAASSLNSLAARVAHVQPVAVEHDLRAADAQWAIQRELRLIALLLPAQSGVEAFLAGGHGDPAFKVEASRGCSCARCASQDWICGVALARLRRDSRPALAANRAPPTADRSGQHSRLCGRARNGRSAPATTSNADRARVPWSTPCAPRRCAPLFHSASPQ